MGGGEIEMMIERQGKMPAFRQRLWREGRRTMGFCERVLSGAVGEF